MEKEKSKEKNNWKVAFFLLVTYLIGYSCGKKSK